MTSGSISQVFTRIFDIYVDNLPSIIGLGLLFTVLTAFESQTSSPGKKWWKNPGLPTDISYALIHTVMAPYIKYPIIIIVFLALSTSLSPSGVEDFFDGKNGIIRGLPFWWQALIYVVLSDFLMYWIHRGFHTAQLWRYHAIHHSAKEVDWTTTYRFHPVNLMLQPALVSLIMVFLGVSPEVVIFFLPFDSLSAAFVHANVNWSFGPLKYIIATPVFHRWHHGPVDDGGSSNFAPTFAFWDWMFGTFHMPEGRLPQTFGNDDHNFPEGYFKQLVYPFRKVTPEAEAATPAQPQSAH
jgi:sterol desaturase/sphingolipid hydroxylase (fatty acid hydroxylase superfamily)